MNPTATDPMVGRVLDGRYRIDGRIASGGMASVYVATDTRLERRVAVKMLHPHLADDPETSARFEREARSAARLAHPNVVAVFDQGSDGHNAFLVMEYVPGVTLRAVLRDRGRLSVSEAVAVMDHVLAALGAAHEAGLVHRDVKPENVLVTADGRVKVADFGLARQILGDTVTLTGAGIPGTAAYLPPETIERGVVDARSDVYAAGVMFYELLAGSTPFTADTSFAALARHVNEDVPAPGSRVRGIPPQIDSLVELATARDPRNRPADASAMHAELVGVRDRLGLHGRVPAPTADAVTATLPNQLVPTGTTRVAASPGLAGGATAVTSTMPPSGPPAQAASGRRRRRRWPFLLIALLVTIGLAIAAGWWLASGRYTHAPKVLGLSRSAADAKLSADHLQAHYLSPVHSPTYAVGSIASESPGAGHRVSRHGTVDLRLSLGPITHVIQSYAGSSVSSATSNLESLHFKIGTHHHAYSATIPKGEVISTDPAAGTTLAEGKTVDLTISKGQAPVAVPSVSGMSGDDATQLLSQHDGFAVTPQQKYSSSVAAGQAIGTSPTAGTKLPHGAPVTLVISKGPHLYPVPNVQGESIQQAVKDIKAAGFAPKPIEAIPFGPGEVLHETPDGQQPKGTTIKLYYY